MIKESYSDKVFNLGEQEIYLHTTRKKALQVMHKGMICYHLSTNDLRWEVADHYGDGYDLMAIKNGKTVKLELKAIDLNEISNDSKSFTQTVSPNEIVNATHLIISVFNGITLIDNYVMTLKQFYGHHSHTKKFSNYKNFEDYKKACKKIVNAKSKSKKGNTVKAPRLNMDISCSLEGFKDKKWKLEEYSGSWENLDR